MAIAVVVAVAAVVAILTASGSSFDSKASGEHLIRDYVGKFGHGAKLTLVNCPGGIAQKRGGAYGCKVALRNPTNGQTAAGTITIHMVSGHKVAITGAPDIHLR